MRRSRSPAMRAARRTARRRSSAGSRRPESRAPSVIAVVATLVAALIANAGKLAEYLAEAEIRDRVLEVRDHAAPRAHIRIGHVFEGQRDAHFVVFGRRDAMAQR